MEVNQSQLLEIGLNLAGFLAGGGIMLVVASLLKREKVQSEPVTAPAVNQVASEVPGSASPIGSGKNFQFIDLSPEQLGQRRPEPERLIKPGRRNRTEVYELARQMLSDRKSSEEISRQLPLSEAELSLLSVSSNQDQGVKNV